MAVTSVKILHNGWTASGTTGSGVTFNVVYQVEVDDRNDGPLIVLNADDGTNRIPIPGESYNIGNEQDAFAFVKSVNPTPVAELVWNVAVTFGPREPGDSKDGPDGQEPKGLDSNGQPTDDPLKEAAIIRVSTVNTRRAALRGAYLGKGIELKDGRFEFEQIGIAGSKPPIPNPWHTTWDRKGGIKDTTPLTNSVFTPFEPPPEIDYSRTRVSISMNLAMHHWWHPSFWLRYVNLVNTKEMTFLWPNFGDVLQEVAYAKPFCCRVMAVSVSPKIKNGRMFWALDVELLIDNLFSWRLDILDRGYCETSNKMVSEGAPAKNNIVDGQGLPLAEPVLLDGHGNQLDLEFANAVYLRYGVYPEMNLVQLWGIHNPQALQDEMNNG